MFQRRYIRLKICQLHNSSTRYNPRKMAFIMAFSKLKLKIHGKKFLAINNVSSYNSKALMANLQPSSTLVDRESTHPSPRVNSNLIFPALSSHCVWQMFTRAFINVSPPSLRSLGQMNIKYAGWIVLFRQMCSSSQALKTFRYRDVCLRS